ncbi:hypothetical protein TNCV_4539921 [Trichonephila clavipes]|nr:hypothetical protein TNCV_4539921 [Trichonephila clavipes]
MDEQLKTLLEGINALKKVQKRSRVVSKKCKRDKNRLGRSGETFGKCAEMSRRASKIRILEQKRGTEIEKSTEQVDERNEEVKGNFNLVSQRVEDL